ncbi:MAG: cupin domain-containing protein [Sandaracinaceae bacterium]|nr:cupin domain-containing protein [Sandaracinaceae bacterium]
MSAPVDDHGTHDPGDEEADAIVRALGLVPHPEGGFYRESYRAPLVLPASALSARHGGDRSASTAIYFLVPRRSFSALHRIASDEVWHFYAGAPLEIVELAPDGALTRTVLGADLRAGERPQHVVPAGAWFGSRVLAGTDARGDHALVGCTVAPGFDFADFELGTRDALVRMFPAHAAIVTELTR